MSFKTTLAKPFAKRVATKFYKRSNNAIEMQQKVFQTLISQAKNIQKVIDENANEIEALDQNIGDGDHVFNVQRGLKLVVELENTIKDLPTDKALNMIAMKVLSGIGGSSGALFGTFFMSMAKTPDLNKNINFNNSNGTACCLRSAD